MENFYLGYLLDFPRLMTPEGTERYCWDHRNRGGLKKKPWIMLVYVDGLVLLGKSSPETIDFPIKYGAFRFQWSLKPIH